MHLTGGVRAHHVRRFHGAGQSDGATRSAFGIGIQRLLECRLVQFLGRHGRGVAHVAGWNGYGVGTANAVGRVVVVVVKQGIEAFGRQLVAAKTAQQFAHHQVGLFVCRTKQGLRRQMAQIGVHNGQRHDIGRQQLPGAALLFRFQVGHGRGILFDGPDAALGNGRGTVLLLQLLLQRLQTGRHEGPAARTDDEEIVARRRRIMWLLLIGKTFHPLPRALAGPAARPAGTGRT